MKIEHPIYEDGVIAIALNAVNESDAENSLFNLAIKYLKPENYKNSEGELVKLTNVMGGETDWFIIPSSLGFPMAKTLVEQKVSGLRGFNEDGFQKMINWMIEMEEIECGMSY